MVKVLDYMSMGTRECPPFICKYYIIYLNFAIDSIKHLRKIKTDELEGLSHSCDWLKIRFLYYLSTWK